MATLQQHKEPITGRDGTYRNILEKGFKLMGKIANRGDLHHPRPALEGMQVAQQVFHFKVALRLGLPTRQGRTRAFENIEGFFEEDFL